MIRMQRALTAAMALSVAMLAITGRAWAGVDLRSIDVGGYPTVRFAVVTPHPSKRPPAVRENGAPVVGLEAHNLGSSKSVVLAVDRSRSMAGQSLLDAAAAADSFVRQKPASDRIGIVEFGRTAVALTGFSTSTIDADGALRTLAVDSHQGTALYDAVVMGSSELASQPQGGRVMIVLTDGQDVSSKATLDRAIAAATAAGVRVYPIAIEGPGYTPAPLRRLASATGGTFETAATTSDLESTYSKIAEQLARTWDVRYLTSSRPGDKLTLRVTVAGEGVVTRTVVAPTTGGAKSDGGSPSTLVPAKAVKSNAATLVVALLAGLLVLLAFFAIASAQKASWVRKRLEPHLAAATKRSRKRLTREERMAGVAGMLRITERMFGNLKQWKALRRLLERADVPMKPAEFAWIALAAGLLGGVILGLAAGAALFALIGFAAGAAVPVGVLWFKAKRRLSAFENQLPDLLITLAASLKAGHSFRHGIQTVVDEGQPPAAAEFKRVLTDARLGRPMEDSLLEMANRVGSKNFDFVITCVTIQRQVGGSLAGLFDMVADTVRQRQQFARRIRSLTAMGRMSAYVLAGLPIFLAIMMTLTDRRYMEPLWHSGAGHMMLVVAGVMMTIGSLILKKIVSFRG